MSVKENSDRSIALENSYVYDVYEKIHYNNHNTVKPSPKVVQFLKDLEPGSLVCDIGCGGDGQYFDVRSHVYTIGGDKSINLCTLNRQQQRDNKNNEIIILDNLSLPFRDSSLDAILSLTVIHHFASKERRICALKEFARVLRIGGRLMITVWAMEHYEFKSQDVLIPCCSTTMKNSNSCSSTNTNYTSKSDLNSEDETCYSFIRRAIKKFTIKKNSYSSWLNNNNNNNKNDKQYLDQQQIYLDNINDIPIEIRSTSSLPSSPINNKNNNNINNSNNNNNKNNKTKSIKQNRSIYNESINSIKKHIFKQRSLNEDDLNDNNRLKEKELIRKNIQKQASLEENCMQNNRNNSNSNHHHHHHHHHNHHHYHYFHSHYQHTLKGSIKRFQLIKSEITNKIKTSTEHVASTSSFKNGFVKIFQNWKLYTNNKRKHSNHDDNDSIKDVCSTSDTSMEDSEDSFASVIFIPKSTNNINNSDSTNSDLCNLINSPIIGHHSSMVNGKIAIIAKPFPKLLSLELFNPEIDDKDSDSSCIPSPLSLNNDDTSSYILKSSDSDQTNFNFTNKNYQNLDDTTTTTKTKIPKTPPTTTISSTSSTPSATIKDVKSQFNCDMLNQQNEYLIKFSNILFNDNNCNFQKDNSKDSLLSENGLGGEIIHHKYYHVFKKGELDQLIENYVENLHIISSYYDHSCWCIIAEKVQVWTI